MKQYGSIINRICEKTSLKMPFVGMGATEYLYSDRQAYTVVELSKETVELDGIDYPKFIWITKDKAIPTEKFNYFGNQDYTFETDETASKIMYQLHKSTATYRHLPHSGSLTKNCQAITLGHRSEYTDPSF